MVSLRLTEFIDPKVCDNLSAYSALLNEPSLGVKDVGISSRIISHWAEKKIIRFSQEERDSNRKFSFTDFIALKTVHELRCFGVKLRVIQKIVADLYKPFPMTELHALLPHNPHIFHHKKSADKKESVDFMEFDGNAAEKGGNTAEKDGKSTRNHVNYLHALIVEAVISRASVSIIVFNTGEWFPYIKRNEYLYPADLSHKKAFSAHININITGLLFKYISDDYLAKYLNGLPLFTQAEKDVIVRIKTRDYAKITVLFKSKKHGPVEIIKSTKALHEVLRILRENNHREFIITNKKGEEFRIRDERT